MADYALTDRLLIFPNRRRHASAQRKSIITSLGIFQALASVRSFVYLHGAQASRHLPGTSIVHCCAFTCSRKLVALSLFMLVRCVAGGRPRGSHDPADMMKVLNVMEITGAVITSTSIK